MLLFTLERSFPAPAADAAAWLRGEGSGLAWTTHVGRLRVEHALRDAPGGAHSIMRFDVHGPRAWRLAAPALKLGIVLRSRKLSKQMARERAAKRDAREAR